MRKFKNAKFKIMTIDGQKVRVMICPPRKASGIVSVNPKSKTPQAGALWVARERGLKI